MPPSCQSEYAKLDHFCCKATFAIHWFWAIEQHSWIMEEFRVPSYGALIVWIQTRTRTLPLSSIIDMWPVFYFPGLLCCGWWRISYTSLIHTKIHQRAWRLITPFSLRLVSLSEHNTGRIKAPFHLLVLNSSTWKIKNRVIICLNRLPF